jgi:outer membrane protein TolC
MSLKKIAVCSTLALLALDHPVVAGEKSTGKQQNATGKKDQSAQSALPDKMTLDQCVLLALKQNPQILEAIQQIQLTQGQIISVRAQALPHVGVASAYNQIDQGIIETLGQQEKTWQVAFQATQLIYSGGQVAAALKIANLSNANSFFSLRNVVDQVIATVRTQFYDVLLDRSLVEVQEESVHLLESQLKDQQSRYEAGTVPSFNVLQAQVQLSNQIPVLIKAKNTYLISQLNISKTLGVPYDTWHPGKSSINAAGELSYHERVVNTDEAIRFAKEHRSSLKIQRQNILIQLQAIKVALAGYQPQISANAGWEFHNSVLSNQLDQVVNGWFFGATGNWAIFDGLQTYGNVKQARAQLETAKVAYEDGVLQVELEVQQALANLQEAKETIMSQTKNVEQALEALRLSQERLNAGAGTQLDVLNAQVQLTQARTNKLQALRDYDVALAELDRVTGANTVYLDSFQDPLVKKKILDQNMNAPAGKLPAKTPAKPAGKKSGSA